jgi:hypothetical protein
MSAANSTKTEQPALRLLTQVANRSYPGGHQRVSESHRQVEFSNFRIIFAPLRATRRSAAARRVWKSVLKICRLAGNRFRGTGNSFAQCRAWLVRRLHSA